MDREQLFVRTVQELADVANDNSVDEYRLVKSSGLLRNLMLDESPLMHQINRQRRRRVRFDAVAEDAYVRMVLEYKPMFWFWMEGISPRLGLRPNKTTESLTLDQWLAKRGGVVEGDDISVKDLILQVAHIEGGVHAGTPKDELERLLNEVNRGFAVAGSGAITRTMRGIADVVVTALRPLFPTGVVPPPEPVA